MNDSEWMTVKTKRNNQIKKQSNNTRLWQSEDFTNSVKSSVKNSVKNSAKNNDRQIFHRNKKYNSLIDNIDRNQMVFNENNVDKKNFNYKKILCKNVNASGKCIYNNKCLYAHSLQEQNVEPIRIISYDMIKKNDNLSHINLSKNRQLYNNLVCLSKLCPQCNDNICTGGYNCKHGACDKKYVICQTDLNKGTCDGKCGKIHLTTKGLIPYGANIMKSSKNRPICHININDFFFINDNICRNDLKYTDNIEDDNSIISNDDDDAISNGSNKSDNRMLHDIMCIDLQKKEDLINTSIFKINLEKIKK